MILFFFRALIGIKKQLVLFLALFVFSLTGFGFFPLKAIQAQESSQNPANSSYYNPKPDDHDLELPMPCGLKMIFKVAAIPAAGLFGDVELKQGISAQNKKGFADRPFQSQLASTLKLENFNDDFRDKLTKILADKADYQLYLIGKYEVSVGQWQSVMEGCQALGTGSELPMTNISYIDANNFSYTYMAWLTKNHLEYLPSFPSDAKYIGFIRLPTEAEWEYAARGGQAVTPDEMEKEMLFPNPNKLSLSEFAFFSAEKGIETGPKPIGSLAPNPLGLYDTAGNVSELMLDKFKNSIGTRLQGTTGGNLLKGGSYLDSGGEILPGSRQELPQFTKAGLNKVPYMGIRLALASTNSTDQTRTRTLQQEYKNISEIDAKTQEQLQKLKDNVIQQEQNESETLDDVNKLKQNETETLENVAQEEQNIPVQLDPKVLLALDPENKIKGLLPFIESNGQKTALSSLLDDFTRFNEIKAIESGEQAQALFNSVLYAAYGLRDTSLRRNRNFSLILLEQSNIIDFNKELTSLKEAVLKTDNKEEITDINKAIDDFNSQITVSQQKIEELKIIVDNFNVALDNQFAYYKSSLQYLAELDEQIVTDVLDMAIQQFAGSDSYSRTMTNAIKETQRDIQFFWNEEAAKVLLENVALPLPK